MKYRNNTYFENLDFADAELLDRESYVNRRSRVIVTIPALNMTSVDIQKMMEAGINAIRFNIVTSTYGDKLRIMSKLEKAVQKCCIKYNVPDWPIATSIGLKGSMVRTGFLEEEHLTEITIKAGTEIILTRNIKQMKKCNEHKIFIDNPNLLKDYPIGTEISIARENIIVVCEKIISDDSILCKVITGGNLYSLASVHGRGVTYTMPNLSNKDMETIEFAAKNNIDIIELNYVRHPETVRLAKNFLKSQPSRPVLLSGLATQQCLENLDDIIKESDGIILLREFMPYELPRTHSYKMLKIQKLVSAKCQQAGKPFYLSGDVLPKSLNTGVRSDMEVADISYSLFDGVTGFVLKDCYDPDYILETVNLLNEICKSVECYTNGKNEFWRLGYEIKIPANAAEAAVLSCVAMANVVRANLIILPTVSGRTARSLCWMKPSCLVITVSKNPRINKILNTYRCVIPLLYKGSPHKTWHHTVKDRVDFAVDFAVKRGYAVYGHQYVTLTRGSEFSCYCDTVQVSQVTLLGMKTIKC